MDQSSKFSVSNVNEWQMAARILERAGELIKENGWQQGAIEHISQYCALTAMESAWSELRASLVDFNYARDAISTVIGVSREPIELANDTLDIPYWGRHLMEWNDAPGRTENEVISTLTNAASFARSAAIKHGAGM